MTNTPTATTLMLDGMALLRTGDLRAADQRFRSAYGLDRGNAHALQGLGIVAHRTGDFVLAVEFFDRALAVDLALAVTSFETALLHAPELPSALINMATALYASSRLDDAVAALERARNIEPNAPELLNNLGNFYKDQGRLNLALACYQQALELNPMLQQAFSNKLAALETDASLTPPQILDQHC